jgi:hypothetical protein
LIRGLTAICRQSGHLAAQRGGLLIPLEIAHDSEMKSPGIPI